MKRGWISLHRQIQDHWLWEDRPFSRGQAWIDLLMLANHEDKKIIFDGNLFDVKRGQIITSLRKIGERWGWSKNKVCKFLEVLEADEMLIQIRDTKKTAISIANYGVYQNQADTEGTQKGQSRDTEGTQKATNNNDNNVNNDNKNNGQSSADKPQTRKFIIPSIEDIKAYCIERNNNVNPEKFFDHYQSNGWKVGKNSMKDWKAAVRTWEKTSYDKPPVQVPKAYDPTDSW